MKSSRKPKVKKPAQVQHALRIDRSRPLYKDSGRGKSSWAEVLMKAAVDDRESRSKQGTATGKRPHPFDMTQAAMFQTSNTHHAAAIQAMKNATVGLGFVTEYDRLLRAHLKRTQLGLPPEEAKKVADSVLLNERTKVSLALDPLCSVSFQDLMNAVGEDLADTHNGYVEVVRKGEGEAITGLHHIPANEAWVYVENEDHDYHFEVQSCVASNQRTRKFARFGDKAGFLERTSGGAGKGLRPQDVSEVIHFKYPSAISRYYGVPTWLSAVAAIELVQALHQHEFDFYNNRGVPEFLLFLLGKKLDDKEWQAVKDVFEGSIGLGNQHKTGAFNFAGTDLTVQLEKLAMEGKSDGRFSEMSQSLALEIVSGHRIPPLLAGITIPGRLGAANEVVNSLMSYQILTVAPNQQTIQATFGNTLANPDMNGGLALTYDDFELRTILDVFPIGILDTASRMKQSPAEAAAQGRDLGEGLKKADAALRTPDLAEVLSVLLERAAAA